MKRLPSCWLLVALVVFPVMACAEAAVRTGEHPGFTRLVVEDPSIRSWQLGRSAEGYRLRLTPTARAFALSRAFRAITRKRLASLAMAGNGDLDVGLGCACHIEAFEIRPGVIVLDIRDGPPSSPSTSNRFLWRSRLPNQLLQLRILLRLRHPPTIGARSLPHLSERQSLPSRRRS